VGLVSRPVAVVGSLVAVALAFVVARTEPDESLTFAPFAAHAEVGEVSHAEGLTAAVDDARLVDTLTLDRWVGETTGMWLVVDARMEPTRSPSLAHAALRVGDRRWTASPRPGVGALAGSIDPGLPLAGAVVFELPVELLDEPAARHAVVQLSIDGDTRLRPVLEVVLDLTSLPHVAEFEAPRTERVTW